MLTVSRLARSCGLSRSTLLYYESIGLLKPAVRSAANYRRYGDKDLERLRQICAYREAGLKLEDIRQILDRPETDASSVLKRRLIELSAEIEALREHQRSILRLLQSKQSLWRTKVITKDRLVSIMRASGMTDADMNRFHTEFERDAPDEHQEFLEFLHIPADEIRTIREHSRAGQKR
jgi:DNA-binding transcriptional MerR regulator